MTLGCTITQLQKNMPVSEFALWVAYRKKYGPLNPVRKYDAGHAIIATMINNAHGGKAKPFDFMPYGDRIDSEEITGEQFIERLSSAKGVRVAR